MEKEGVESLSSGTAKENEGAAGLPAGSSSSPTRVKAKEGLRGRGAGESSSATVNDMLGTAGVDTGESARPGAVDMVLIDIPANASDSCDSGSRPASGSAPRVVEAVVAPPGGVGRGRLLSCVAGGSAKDDEAAKVAATGDWRVGEDPPSVAARLSGEVADGEDGETSETERLRFEADALMGEGRGRREMELEAGATGRGRPVAAGEEVGRGLPAAAEAKGADGRGAVCGA